LKRGFMQIINSAYQEWIDANVPTDCKGECRPMAEAMAEAFPELRVVGLVGIFSAHAWCVDQDNYVVDPTSHQFDTLPDYDTDCRLDVEDFPTGKCMQCGDVIYPDTERNRIMYGGHMDLGPHDECMEQFMRDLQSDNEQPY